MKSKRINLSNKIAKQFHQVYFGGNWTDSNFSDSVKDITWQEAVTQIKNLNTIATLLFHTGYFVEAVMRVLEGGPLDAKDEFSFNHPPIASQIDWDTFLEKSWNNAKRFTRLIEQLPEEKLWEEFVDSRYGDYYTNLTGIFEHTHYHLGQIVLIKKIIRNSDA